MQKIIKKNIHYIIILMCAIYVILPYFSGKICVGHDIEFHMTNINGMIDSVKNGNLIPTKVLDNNLNDFGYGALIFYPALLYYIATYISIIFGIGSLGSIKVLFFLIILFSGIAMFLLTNRVFKNKNAALVSSIFYMTSSYLYTDIFVRFALSETGIFIFAPLTILGIYELLHSNKKTFLIIGATGMVYSHILMTIFLIIFIAIYLLINIKYVLKKEVLKNIMISGIIIIIMIMPFVGDLLQHKLFADYTVFADDIMTNQIDDIGEYRGLNLYDYTKNNLVSGLTYQISTVVIILCFITIFKFKEFKFKNPNKLHLISIIIITVISIILTLKFVNWNYLPQTLSYIQFPWRLVLYVTMGACIISSLPIILIKKEYQKYIILLLIILSLNFYNGIFYYNNLQDIDNKLIETFSDLGSQQEYLPMSTNNNIDYYLDRSNEIIVKDGLAIIDMQYNEVPELTAIFTNVEKNTIIELPRTFYYGYEIYYNTENDSLKLEYYENSNGFIELKIPEEDGELIVKYTGTLINKVSSYIALITLIGIIIYISCNSIKINNNK